MNLSLGIVGLPNVGKSTLFNALTKQQVLAENYPFATIDPNHGIVPVHDERLEKIAAIEKPDKLVPAVVEFVDIAGLVKGAADGQGLGNKFLATIKEVSAIVQVVRAFESGGITHVEESVDPIRDIELIQAELILKDIETVANRMSVLKGKARTDKKIAEATQHLEDLMQHLEHEKLAIDFEVNEKDEEIYKTRKELFLLTDKPMMYLVNVEDERAVEAKNMLRDYLGNEKGIITIDIKQEYELTQMTDEERNEFMEDLGLDQTGLQLLSREAYSLLGLISFFTSGPKETKAWTIRQGFKAPQAAGTIHGDFEKAFIAADVVKWNDFIECEGWNGARDRGKVGLQGKGYVVEDGDVMLFKHNA